MISRQVLTEADRNFSTKLPALIPDFRHWIRQLAPVLLEDPSLTDVARAARIIHPKDAPILAAAINAEVDFLITWNTRHFHKSAVVKAVRFKIMIPGDFLKAFRQSLSNS